MNRTLAAVAATMALLSPATAEAAVDLAGTTVLQGAGAGVTQIELDRPATLDKTALRVDGEGSFAGFALVAEGDDPERPVLTGGRVRAAGVRDRTFMMSANAAIDDFTDAVEVPAGRYRLYLLADRPATVRLAAGDRAGERALSTLRPVRFDLRRPPVQFLPHGFTGVGDHATLGGPGLMLGVLSDVYSAMTVDNTTACWFEGEEAAANPVAFAPGCPGASRRLSTNTVYFNPSRGGNGSTAIALTSEGGVFGQGYGIASASVRESIAYDAMWLTLDRSPWEEGAPAADATASVAPATGGTSAASGGRAASGAASSPVASGVPAAAPVGKGSALRVSVPRTSRSVFLRSGLRVAVSGVQGTQRLRALLGRRTVAVGSARSRGGRAVVVLRLTRSGRRAVGTTRGPLRLTVVGAGITRRVTLR